MLKIGLVGVGGISGSHIPAWDAMEDAQLTAICDIRAERMEPYPDKRHYLDFDEMLEKEELDIVDICLPTYLHADFAVKAMEKGIHVICEKPISLKQEDVERTYSTAANHNVNFMIAQVLRFWPEYEYAKEVFDSGKYGKLLSGYMGRLGNCPGWSWDNWMRDEKRSGLVPYDLHIHDLDFMVYAFGIPSNVSSHRSRKPDQDYISALYEYPDFFITAEAAWYGAPYAFSSNFRFQFEEAVVAYERGQLTVYQKDGQILNPFDAASADTGSMIAPNSNAYANEIRYFADCVKAGVFPDKVQAKELNAVVEILNSL